MEERHWSTGTNGDDGRWSSEDPSDSRRPSSTEEKRTRAALSLSLSLFLFSGRPTEEMLTAMVVDDDEPCPDKEGGFDHVLFLFLPPSPFLVYSCFSCSCFSCSSSFISFSLFFLSHAADAPKQPRKRRLAQRSGAADGSGGGGLASKL